jgi:hypothetical protein
MKYVVMVSAGEPQIFVFQAAIAHDDMARVLRSFGKPIRAGFVYLMSSDGAINCTGKSESLKLSSDPEADTAMLKRQLGGDDSPW